MSGCKNEMCLGMHPHKVLKILWLRLAKNAFKRHLMLFECSIQHSLYNTTMTGTERVRSFLKEGELFIHGELLKISLHCWEF